MKWSGSWTGWALVGPSKWKILYYFYSVLAHPNSKHMRLIFHKHSLLLLAVRFLFMSKCKMSVQVFSDTFPIQRNWISLVLCTWLPLYPAARWVEKCSGPGFICIPGKGEGFRSITDRAALVTTWITPTHSWSFWKSDTFIIKLKKHIVHKICCQEKVITAPLPAGMNAENLQLFTCIVLAHFITMAWKKRKLQSMDNVQVK